MRLVIRLGLIMALTLAIVGMGVHYGATREQHWPYPSADALATDYSAHIGEKVFLFGTVERVDQNSIEITVRYTDGRLTMTVIGADVTVQPGGVIQVFGEVRPGMVISANNVVVVNPSGSSKLYKYIVSLIGAALVLVVFFKQWRIDTRKLNFEVRRDG